MSQLQLKEVVSPRRTMLGTLTRRLLRPAGPSNIITLVLLGVIGKIIKITLIKNTYNLTFGGPKLVIFTKNTRKNYMAIKLMSNIDS